MMQYIIGILGGFVIGYIYGSISEIDLFRDRDSKRGVK